MSPLFLPSADSLSSQVQDPYSATPLVFMHFNADTCRGGNYFLSTANDNKRISKVLLIYPSPSSVSTYIET
jgi:hypothetical protein